MPHNSKPHGSICTNPSKHGPTIAAVLLICCLFLFQVQDSFVCSSKLRTLSELDCQVTVLGATASVKNTLACKPLAEEPASPPWQLHCWPGMKPVAQNVIQGKKTPNLTSCSCFSNSGNFQGICQLFLQFVDPGLTRRPNKDTTPKDPQLHHTAAPAVCLQLFQARRWEVLFPARYSAKGWRFEAGNLTAAQKNFSVAQIQHRQKLC